MEFIKEKKQFTPPQGLGTKVSCDEVERFIAECLETYGIPGTKAAVMAKVLVVADTRGHYSHGLQRLDFYVDEIRHGCYNGGADPVVLKESPGTALVDGRNGLGPVVGDYCMELAVQKAKEIGVGLVVVRGSNHYGIAGYYSMKALQAGYIGMSFTNANSGVVATRGAKGVVGTNPISLAAPADNNDSFVLDMATSVVASGKVEVANLKGEDIPLGWGVDKNGIVTSDTRLVLHDEGWLLPLGGSELTSGYKGFGLGLMVEVLCGILAGGDYGQTIRDWRERDRAANLSQCFMAINPQFFEPGFTGRMTGLMDQCRNMEPVDPDRPVLVAGDHERSHINKVNQHGGITYHINQIKDSWQLAKYLGVPPMKTA